MKDELYITINHLEEYGGVTHLKVGEQLLLKKEVDNPYDDEAIAVYTKNKKIKCGYVANSVYSVARGTQSAGRVYEKIKEQATCMIRFILEDRIIAMVV